MPLRETKEATIANGASLSGAIAVGQGVPVAILMPGTFTGTSMTFQGSLDGTTFTNLYDTSGTEVSITVAASRLISLEAIFFPAIPYLKVRSGTAGSPTAEGGARTLSIVTRREPT
jgi:hypothetical protein